MGQTTWHLLVFHKGKMHEKVIPRTPEKTEQVKQKVRELRAKGIKCHVAGLTDKRKYPPGHEVVENVQAGKKWCPYCGEWRWFKVPKYTKNAEFNTREWFLNSFWRQGIKCCSWCGISEYDFYVGAANADFNEVRGARRRRRGRKRR